MADTVTLLALFKSCELPLVSPLYSAVTAGSMRNNPHAASFQASRLVHMFPGRRRRALEQDLMQVLLLGTILTAQRRQSIGRQPTENAALLAEAQ
jgi:hypothetical protein